MTIPERMVNGQPGLVAQLDGVVTVFAFDIAGDRIKHIWADHAGWNARQHALPDGRYLDIIRSLWQRS
jgi:hypothetical protein